MERIRTKLLAAMGEHWRQSRAGYLGTCSHTTEGMHISSEERSRAHMKSLSALGGKAIVGTSPSGGMLSRWQERMCDASAVARRCSRTLCIRMWRQSRPTGPRAGRALQRIAPCRAGTTQEENSVSPPDVERRDCKSNQRLRGSKEVPGGAHSLISSAPRASSCQSSSADSFASAACENGRSSEVRRRHRSKPRRASTGAALQERRERRAGRRTSNSSPQRAFWMRKIIAR